MVRSECVMKGVTIQDMMPLIQKYEASAKYVERWFTIQKYEIIKKEENEQIDYVLFSMPDPYSNRDAVLKSKWYKIEDNEILKIRKSTDMNIVSAEGGVERLSYYNAQLIKEQDNNLIISDIYSIDLNGFLPRMWVNDPMAEECVERLKNMYKLL